MELKTYKLEELVKQNLYNTKRILIHNDARDIKVYRFTSKLVPLATHPEVIQWDYVKRFKKELLDIGDYVKSHNLRVSAHPDHFTLLNTPKADVLDTSIRDLHYHGTLFEGMGLSEEEGKLVLHVGGLYEGKAEALQRFEKNFLELPSSIRKRIILENDDKIYTAKDVLKLCRKLKIPMVLDIHHHWCHHEGEDIVDMIEAIFQTWEGEKFPPKIHVSSPKPGKNIRAHADNVDVKFFYAFLEKALRLNHNFDVMIEAKNKDKALLNLMKELENYKNIIILDGASFEINP